MRLRRCLLGKLTVGHTIRSSALCFKRFAKKNKLFSSQLKRTNCLWLEKKFILLLYIICTCELEGMKEQAADSCFPVALPAAAAAWSAFGISFLSLLSSLAAMSAIALPVWRCLCEKKKVFHLWLKSNHVFQTETKNLLSTPDFSFLDSFYETWTIYLLLPSGHPHALFSFPARWKSDSVIVFIPWPTGREM